MTSSKQSFAKKRHVRQHKRPVVGAVYCGLLPAVITIGAAFKGLISGMQQSINIGEVVSKNNKNNNKKSTHPKHPGRYQKKKNKGKVGFKEGRPSRYSSWNTVRKPCFFTGTIGIVARVWCERLVSQLIQLSIAAHHTIPHAYLRLLVVLLIKASGRRTFCARCRVARALPFGHYLRSLLVVWKVTLSIVVCLHQCKGR